MKLHMQSHRVHVDIQRNVSMITKEHEYIPEGAADDSRKADEIGTLLNRTVHDTVAILRSSEPDTSSGFTCIRKQ